jgi:tRNA nucleotidyltransferase (CCA-adding enzyme)
MQEMSSSFKTFLTEIRPTQNQHDDMRTGYKALKNRLLDDEKLSPIIVSTFLQGSFRRATAVRPKGDKRADVDLVVVTKLKREEYTPQQAMDRFILRRPRSGDHVSAV